MSYSICISLSLSVCVCVCVCPYCSSLESSVDAAFTALSKTHGGGGTDGSTAVVAVIHDGQLVVGNAGDSRWEQYRRSGGGRGSGS